MLQWYRDLREAVETGFEVYLRPDPVIGAVGVLALLSGAWGSAWWLAFGESLVDWAAIPTLTTGVLCLRGNYWKYLAQKGEGGGDE